MSEIWCVWMTVHEWQIIWYLSVKFVFYDGIVGLIFGALFAFFFFCHILGSMTVFVGFFHR